MDEERKTRLDALTDTLMDEFTTEADPANWTGTGVAPSDMTPNIRGARNWDVKNANQIGALLARVIDLRAKLAAPIAPPTPGAPTPPDDAADADISKYERMAKDVLNKAIERHSGRA